MTLPEFDPVDVPLHGVHLVEASAGTGKTWNLSALYVRLVLERGWLPQQILVVTFTVAATAELRDRIRKRLVEARHALHHPDHDDPLMRRLLDTMRTRGGLADDEIGRRLDAALATFDEAAVFTIHGFCMRALADAPFTSGLPLAMAVAHDDDEALAQVAADVWRRHVADPAAAVGAPLAAALRNAKDSPGRWAALLKRRLARPLATLRWPDGLDDLPPAAPDAVLAQAHTQARQRWAAQLDDLLQTLAKALDDGVLKGNMVTPGTIAAAVEAWTALMSGEDALRPLAPKLAERLALLTRAGLAHRTKKGKVPPGHPLADALDSLLTERLQALRHGALLRLRLLRTLLNEGATALAASRRERRVIATDDLLTLLQRRLAGADGEAAAQALRDSLRLRFPVAMIDEFQDTDPVQWSIFSSVYAGGGTAHPLFLVGDPKQAIYSFRQADLRTYLQARAQATQCSSLRDNQRATQPLITALNALWGHNDRGFLQNGLAYEPVRFGRKPRAVLEDRTQAQPAALQVRWLGTGADGVQLSVPAARTRAARDTAAEIARLVRAGRQHLITLDGAPLAPRDIAVLVRSHVEGRLMRQALAAWGLGCVELSRASVFSSADARELRTVLAAVHDPAREPRLRAALATEAMGWTADALDALGDDSAALANEVERFAAWREVWQHRGVGPMLRRWLHEAGVAARLLTRPDGARRMTDLLHLFEALHEAAATHEDPAMLLHWLDTQCRDPQERDETQLRLESDSDLIAIVTVHKSKGLEYPIVFCPFLWTTGRAPATRSDGVFTRDADGEVVLDFRAGVDDDFPADEVKRAARLDDAAERQRLNYVALTRAVHRCHVVAGCAGKKRQAFPASLYALVAADGMDGAEWPTGRPTAAEVEAGFVTWGARAAPHGSLAEIGTPPAPVPLAPPDADAARAPVARTAPAVPPAWWIGSYSALVRGALHERAAVDHDQHAGAAPAEVDSAVDDTPDDFAPPADDIVAFPRGAAAGEALHAMLEEIDFTRPATQAGGIERAIKQLRADAPAGRDIDAALQTRRLQSLLKDLLTTPLPGAPGEPPLRLDTLAPTACRAEMEFHLDAPEVSPQALSALLQRHGVPAPTLTGGTLRGYLKGFIDLTLAHDGRWYVLDWKSNHLGERAADYAPERLEAAMTQHGYHLQALLYLLALHRLLRQRVTGYSPEAHLGGAWYLFVRGVRPHWRDRDGRPTGVWFHRPDPALLNALDRLFAGRGAA